MQQTHLRPQMKNSEPQNYSQIPLRQHLFPSVMKAFRILGNRKMEYNGHTFLHSGPKTGYIATKPLRGHIDRVTLIVPSLFY